MNSEARVGALFFLGLGVATWLTFNTGNRIGSKSEYTVRFRKAGQLKTGDKVTYNGVKVGLIASVLPVVAASGEPLVEVGFSVEEELKSKLLIDTKTAWKIDQGTLGGANMEISSRAGVPITQLGQPGLDGVIGEDTLAIADAVKTIKDTVDENRPELKRMVEQFRVAAERIGDMSEQVRDLVKGNREQVGMLLANATAMTGQIRGAVEDNREQLKLAIAGMNNVAQRLAEVVEENRASVKAMLAKAPGAVDNIGSAAKQIEGAIAENRDELRSTIRKLSELAPRLDQIGADLQVIIKQVAEGKGSLGQLVFNDELHRKAVEAVNNLNQRLEEVKPLTSGVADLRFYAGVDGGTNLDTGASTGYAFLRIEPRPWKFYEGGISYRGAPSDRNTAAEDPDELGLDFNILLGWRFFPDDHEQRYRLSVAAGVIDSKIGGRVDVPLWSDALKLRTMIRAKDNDREADDRRFEAGSALLRMTFEYRPFRQYGLYISAGVDDLLDDPAPWVGIRGELLDNDLRNITTLTGLAP